jgi:hypothetical protein
MKNADVWQKLKSPTGSLIHQETNWGYVSLEQKNLALPVV